MRGKTREKAVGIKRPPDDLPRIARAFWRVVPLI